jgi:hypothetical protein
LVDPAGIVITDSSGRDCHNVVWLLAGVPRLEILRVSTLAPVPMLIVSPTDIPSVFLIWMTLSPARAETASPELESPNR